MGVWAKLAELPLPSPAPSAAPAGKSEARLRKSLRLSLSSTMNLLHLVFRNNLTVVAYAQKLERIDVDSDWQQLDATVAEDKLTNTGVVAAKGLISPHIAIRVPARILDGRHEVANNGRIGPVIANEPA